MHPTLYLTEEVRSFIVDRQAAIVINFSGGKDSQTMADLIEKRFGQSHEIYWIFADTGWEQQDTTRWLAAYRWSQLCARSYGRELNIVYNPLRSMLEEIRRRGRWPDKRNRYCTSHAKRAPIQKWIRNTIRNPWIVNAKGMRAEESDTRANMRPWELDTALTATRAKLTKAPRTTYTWLPIHPWKLDQVLNYLEAHHITLHPTYSFLSRFSCRLCVFNSDADLDQIRINDPEAFATVLQMEKAMGHTIRNGANIEQRADAYAARRAHPHLPATAPARPRKEVQGQLCLF